MWQPKISIFTKPWPTLEPARLAQLVSGWGFDGIEYPLRSGFQVDPADAVVQLPIFAATMRQAGLTIMSVAGSLDETTFAACQAAGVPMIRIMLQALPNVGYMAAEKIWLDELTRITPLCERYQVKVGIQNHCGAGVFATMELRHVLEQCPNPYVGAIWDASHSGLAGETAEKALDMIRPYLLLVNLKSAYYQKQYDRSARCAVFKPYFTSGRDGACSWPRIISWLKTEGYTGDLCLPAEYTDNGKVEQLIGPDLAYVRRLLAE
jgi:sugar phosphate isomerase/epimerase